ncbi:MAG: sulfate transporter permease [Pedosphaera sp.]|nr:sulfate transporter permease [Pedosphaera sp.]
MGKKKFNPLPGFGLTMGYTLLYLSVLVLIPIAGLFLKAFQLSWTELWHLIATPRALAAYKLTLSASMISALVNAVFGTLLAWILVRYQFFGKRFIDALVDFPFALPTAVAGLTLSSLFAANGWLGQFLVPLGIKGTYTPLGIIIALTFVGLPFVVRTLQPVLQNLEQEVEEAAATLGASRLRTFVQILIPTLFPTILTGFALSFARAVGEYGSITFISGNLPYKTEIVPSLIVYQLEEHNYPGATAIAAVMLVVSFLILALINWLEVWSGRFNK